MAVPVGFVLARSSRAAVAVQHLMAYPMGFEFEVVVRYRSSSDIMDPSGDIWDPMHGLAGLRGRPGVSDEQLSTDLVLLAIEYSNGASVSTAGPHTDTRPSSPPEALALQPTSGGARNSIAYQIYWLRPLPPEGPVTFACEWRRYGIQRTTHTIDAQVIRDASAGAVELWPPV